MWRPSYVLLLLLGAWSRAGEAEPRASAATSNAAGEAAAASAPPAPALVDDVEEDGSPERERRAAFDPALLLCRGVHHDWRPCALPWPGMASDQQTEQLDAATPFTWERARDEKRSLKFNPWGGKREQPAPAKPRPRKAYFSPWGGKRALPFNSWGGKRSTEALPVERVQDYTLLSDEDDIDEKRTGFHSWGGKRALSEEAGAPHDALAFPLFGDVDSDDAADKRSTFHSWGGKRDSVSTFSDFLPPRLIKRKTKFYPWGGKRSVALDAANQASGGAAVLRRGGADFYPWGGKRSTLAVA